jgi:putative PEP-CTERM system histidine kinase
MSSFGVISYGIAAFAFALLSILLGVSWRGRRVGVVLVLASVTTSIWAGLVALTPNVQDRVVAIFFMEMLRNASWLLALVVIATHSAPAWLINFGRLVSALLVLIAFALPLLASRGSSIGSALLVLSRTGLIAALVGLVLLEQVYRNAGDATRTPLRYLAFGVGGLFAYDLFLYSQAELLRGITTEAWYARGLLNALAVPAIAIAARRAPQWSLDVFVSRQVVFYTTSFAGIGIYMLLMALGGFYVRKFGGEWGHIGQILFFAGAIVVLGFLLASASLRRYARVFISKHFYRNKYDYRIEWLRFIKTLSDVDIDADVRRTSLQAIAQIFPCPAGVLFSYDEVSEHFVPTAAWPMRLDEFGSLAELRNDDPLPRFLSRTKWIIDLQEYDRTPDMYDNIVLPDWIRGRSNARLVSPLLLQDTLTGFVILDDPPPPFDLTYEDRDLLKTVGRHVATHLAQQDANRRLAESRQFEAYNRLTAFMMHDLKNSVAQLQLIVTNAERHKRNPEFIDDAIATIENAADRMRRLIDQLGRKSAAAKSQSVDFMRAAHDAVARCSDRLPQPQLIVGDAGALLVRADAERLTTAIEHLLRNAQDASEEGGTITVQLDRKDGHALLEVTDTGIGMTPEFIRERLFRPFDSTKGSKGMGIGAYQVREYVRSIGGQLEVQSSPGIGTQFCIRLPLIAATPATETAAAERALP